MDESVDSLEYTPSWAVAAVCSLFIVIALLIEHGLHLLTLCLERRKRKTLTQAIYHIKTELRNLGFMSMSLTVAKEPISRICIPINFADSLTPCKRHSGEHFSYEESSCHKGNVSLVSSVSTEQLQLLLFVLAGVYLLSCLLIFLLGDARISKWKSWEEETKTMEFQLSNDPRRFTLTHETSFGQRHLKLWSDYPLLLWPVCLCRQFIEPVSRADYYALRHGFIAIHFNKDFKFDFQKFLSRSLDHDFAVVVKISTWIWIYAILMILFNASEIPSPYWPPFLPLVIILVVGMKLEVIITTMCLKSSHEAVIVPGTLSVTPDNSLFWFGQPRLLLHIIQFVQVQNSFHLAYFIWSWYTFGLESCFHKEIGDIVFTVVIGALVHFLCAYVTLPLYALVAQMGSSTRESIFADRIVEGLKNWHRMAKRNLDENRSCSLSSTSTGRRASISSEEASSVSKPTRTERPKTVGEKTTPSPSSPSLQTFSFLTAGEASSSNTNMSTRVQEFRYPSGRLELLEVQKLAEEIIQCGDSNLPYTGDLSFRLWGRKNKESSPRNQ